LIRRGTALKKPLSEHQPSSFKEGRGWHSHARLLLRTTGENSEVAYVYMQNTQELAKDH